jgi:2-dehydro-3-deoxyphosphooctonate aldolase (KDO 8-P synthase)
VMPLARAAVAAGVDGLFFEVHPDPPKALSDATTQVALADFAVMVKQLLHLYRCVHALHSL